MDKKGVTYQIGYAIGFIVGLVIKFFRWLNALLADMAQGIEEGCDNG